MKSPSLLAFSVASLFDRTQYFAPDSSWVAQYASLKPDYVAGTLYYQAATNNTNLTIQFTQLAKAFNLVHAAYEAGTGNDVGGQFDKPGPELSTYILANR